MPTIEKSSKEELFAYYDDVLNTDKTTYTSSNDEPTPMACVSEILDHVPDELWKREHVRILDPCCGNGNFHLSALYKLLPYHSKRKILENILHFNDINEYRLCNVRNVFHSTNYQLNITCQDFLSMETNNTYDMIVANPPYAKILENGKRASKNHNLIASFIQKSLSLLKPSGYLVFITPNNWMSYADRNTLIEKLTSLQIIHLNIHTAKKYFKKIGSSFTWYIIQHCPSYKDIEVSGVWKKKVYTTFVHSMRRKYIPLLYTPEVQSILNKTVDNTALEKFHIQTSSYLHRYTKKEFIQDTETDIFKYRLIHTPSQHVYSSKPHKFQEGFKVFISTTNTYNVFVDSCGMTQSIVFILCDTEQEARIYARILQHPLYVFINNICRWGNFNNIRILQHFPKPNIDYQGQEDELYQYFQITRDEIDFISTHL